MKKLILSMSLLALLSLGCNEIEDVSEIENTVSAIDKDISHYLNDGKFITKQNFTIDLEKLKNSSTGMNRQAYRTSENCQETNTNTDFAIGTPRIGEQINFLYSSHFEPELVYNNGPKKNGQTKIFHAVKRGLNTVENAIKELNKTNGQQKKHNLFTVSFTNAPIYDDHSNMGLEHGQGWPVYNNYGGVDFSYDGINSIAWVDFGKNAGELGIRQIIAGNVYTVWDRNGYIIERDIILQNNEFMSWAIKSDLTSNNSGTVDCSPEIDIQAVITHFALQSVGLRPLHDGVDFNVNNIDATIFKPSGWGFGPWVLTNDPGAWHPHSWQTLTPGDKQGAWEAAPDRGFVMVPDVTPVPDANQLILHYDFDGDLTSGVVSDQSENNIDGTIIGNLDNDLGVRDMAARFANNSYIDLDGVNFPGEKLPINGYTIGAWIKADQGSFNTSFQPTIFRSLNHMGNSLLSVFLPFGHGVQLGSTTPTPFVFDLINTPITEDQWFHYAITFDAVSREFAMYIDGVVIFESDTPIPSFLPTNSNGTTLIDNWDNSAIIGAWDSNGTNPFIGLMDDFVLYNYALSASDIENLKISGPDGVSVQ